MINLHVLLCHTDQEICLRHSFNELLQIPDYDFNDVSLPTCFTLDHYLKTSDPSTDGWSTYEKKLCKERLKQCGWKDDPVLEIDFFILKSNLIR